MKLTTETKMRFKTATINGDNGTETGFDLSLTISQRDDGKFGIETPEYALDEVFGSHADAEDYILLSYAAPCWDLRIEER